MLVHSVFIRHPWNETIKATSIHLVNHNYIFTTSNVLSINILHWALMMVSEVVNYFEHFITFVVGVVVLKRHYKIILVHN